MKPFTEGLLIGLIFVMATMCAVVISKHIPEKDPEAEKLQLEIQHLKYQVGIDSLRYDMELNFYERRKAK